jgi:uncharacterized membrane protein
LPAKAGIPVLPSACWLILILIQLLWHAILPPPAGTRSWWLTVSAVAPLLLPARGILAGSLRSWTWGGYISLLYFCIGVMEAWSDESSRWLALAQAIIVLLYIAAIVYYARRGNGKSGD